MAALASSASGFAAFTMSASHAAGLNLSLHQLSDLARTGFGSAALSIFGGFVELPAGFSTSRLILAEQIEDESYGR
jgi:diphosphomevalonate decarboxylase